MPPTAQELKINPHLSQNLSTVWPAFKYTGYEGDPDLLGGCKLFNSEDEFEDYATRHPEAQFFNNPALEDEKPKGTDPDAGLAEQVADLKQAFSMQSIENDALKKANAAGQKENERLVVEVDDLGLKLDAAEKALADATEKKKSK